MEKDAEQNISWLLLRASVPAKQIFTEVGELFGLTTMQAVTLWLLKSPDVTMHTMSNKLACDASNVTGLVDKLVTSGFIERVECAEDRRTKLLVLTKKGKRTRQLIERELKKAETEELFSHLDAQEINTLKALLVKIIQ